MNILLVDNDFSIVSCIANLLHHDHKVRITTNGLEALNALKVVHYDVMITEIEMPKMNGIKLLKAIQGKDKRVYFIILTGNPSLKNKSDAKQYGAYAFFTKPLDIDRFMDALNRIEHEINHSKNALVK